MPPRRLLSFPLTWRLGRSSNRSARCPSRDASSIDDTALSIGLLLSDFKGRFAGSTPYRNDVSSASLTSWRSSDSYERTGKPPLQR
jgi:hypothetical protein